jgi:dTDP-4-amino-4,6-dideoxygalactose transaminase
MEGKKRIFLSSPTMNGHEMEYIQEAFDTNWIAPLGENVNQLENTLAEYAGIGYAAALSSGTAALHLAVKLAGVKQGDKVFCTDLTFSASANPIAYEKAIPVFIDSEMDTWNMNPRVLEKAFAKYPEAKAVIVANLYGTPAKLDEIKEICEKHNVPLIEDAAESLGAEYKGKQTGTFGKYGVFSFNGNKIITTSGGGMLVSGDEESIKKARYWATQAKEPGLYYHHTEIGYNYRMSNIVAGIGRGQMFSLGRHIMLKRNIYSSYMKAFSDIKEIKMNPYLECSEPNFWLSCMTLSEVSAVRPLDVMTALEKENIECRPIWKPMHLQPVFSGCDFIRMDEEAKPVSERIFDSGLCLPSDIKNTAEDMYRIIRAVRGLFHG